MRVEKSESSLNALFLTHFEPMLPFFTPENFKNGKNFYGISGVFMRQRIEIFGLKWVN